MKLTKRYRDILRKMQPTLRELAAMDVMRDYTMYRKKYFGRFLPPPNEVAIAILPIAVMEEFYGGGYVGWAYTEGDKPFLGMAIADDCLVTERRLTLLHEMAHLKVNVEHGRSMGHGKYWKTEMKRLQKLGAYDKLL